MARSIAVSFFVLDVRCGWKIYESGDDGNKENI